MSYINCIECDTPIELAADPVVGEILQCPDCCVELEIINLNPLQVDLAPKVEEDWGE